MRPFIVYDSIEVYLAPVPEGEQPRHERERAAVGEMVRGLFGEEAVIAHDEWGAPCLEGRQESISVSHSRTTAAIAIDRCSGWRRECFRKRRWPHTGLRSGLSPEPGRLRKRPTNAREFRASISGATYRFLSRRQKAWKYMREAEN